MAFGINDNMSVSIGEPIIPTEIDGRTMVIVSPNGGGTLVTAVYSHLE
jgi:hypothetical protein